MPSCSGRVSTAGAPLACRCPRRRSAFWGRALRCVPTLRRARVRRLLCTILFTQLPFAADADSLPLNLCRKCHRLDPALHRRRLPLHRFGERGARPAGGVQFKVSAYVQAVAGGSRARLLFQAPVVNPALLRRRQDPYFRFPAVLRCCELSSRLGNVP